MIGRLWRGWTTRENADAYATLLQMTVLPGIHRVQGYRGAFLLRREVGDEVEFTTLTLFTSMEAVRAFAGKDHELAVIPTEGRNLLERCDERAAHFDVLSLPEGPA